MTGSTDFAMRFVSVLCVVPLSALTYRLTSDLAGSGAAVIAGFLVADQSVLLWHGQDARMYTMATAFCLAATWATLRLIAGEWRRRWLVIAGGGMALALYTHYATACVALALNLVALLGLPDRRRLVWLGVQGCVGLVYLPWIYLARHVLFGHSKDWITPAGPLEMAQRTLVAFSAGSAVDQAQAGWLAIPLGVGIGVGGWFLIRRSGGWHWLVITLLPIVAIATVSAVRPMYDERYVVFVTPLALAITGTGVAQLIHRIPYAGWLLAALIATVSLHGLWSYHFNAHFAKSAHWRELAQVVLAHRQPGDLLVVNYPDPAPVFYLRDALPNRLLPATHPFDEVETAAELERLDAQRVWLVPVRADNWDADGVVERWFEDRWVRLQEFSIERTPPLRLYQSPELALRLIPQQQPATFGDAIILETATVTPARPVLPGETIEISLYFRPHRAIAESYTVYTHLLDANGIRRGQHDGIPIRQTLPTTSWQPCVLVLDRHQLAIAGDAPPGEYTLQIGFYKASTGERLPVSGINAAETGDGIVISGIVVRSPE